MMRRDALVRRADGIWYRGHVPIRVELPGELARQARLGDVEVHLSICAPGHDRELVPVVEFDFGRIQYWSDSITIKVGRFRRNSISIY